MSDLIYGLLVAGGLAFWAYLRGRDAGKAKAEQRAADRKENTRKEVATYERDAETQDDPELVRRLTKP